MNFWAGASLTTLFLACGLLHLMYDCLLLVFLSLDQGSSLTRWITDIIDSTVEVLGLDLYLPGSSRLSVLLQSLGPGQTC